MSARGPDALPNVQEWSRGPHGLSGMSRSDRVDLPDVRKWSGGPPMIPEVLGRTSRMSIRFTWMSGSDRVDLPDVREWSGGPPECPGVVGSQ